MQGSGFTPAPSGRAESRWVPRLLTVSAAIERVGRFNLVVACLALLLIVVLVNIEVIMRATINRSTLIADEYGSYLFIVTTVFGFSYALDNDYFLRIEAVFNRFSKRTRSQLIIFGSAVAIVLTIICVVQVAQTAALSHRFGSLSQGAARTPLYVPQALLALGLAMLILSFVRQAALAVVAILAPHIETSSSTQILNH